MYGSADVLPYDPFGYYDDLVTETDPAPPPPTRQDL